MDERTLHEYRNHSRSLAGRYEQAEVHQLQELLLRRFPPGSTVLEIGCGSGRDAAMLVREGRIVTATDGSAEMLAQARTLHPELRDALVHVVLPGRLPFRDGSFDGACALAMLMHLEAEGIGATLREVFRVLKDGAGFLFSVPLRRGDLDAHGRDGKGRLFTGMTADGWIDTAREAGFEAEEQLTMGDGLGRDGIEWGVFVLGKPDGGG